MGASALPSHTCRRLSESICAPNSPGRVLNEFDYTPRDEFFLTSFHGSGTRNCSNNRFCGIWAHAFFSPPKSRGKRSKSRGAAITRKASFIWRYLRPVHRKLVKMSVAH
jgi:hypothetical protein